MTVHVYFIEREGDRAVKIGVSKRPENRLRQLQTGSSEPLRLVASFPFESREEAMRAERDFHERCAAHQIVGEWFQPRAMRNLFKRAEELEPESAVEQPNLHRVTHIGDTATRRIRELLGELKRARADAEEWKRRAIDAEKRLGILALTKN